MKSIRLKNLNGVVSFNKSTISINSEQSSKLNIIPVGVCKYLIDQKKNSQKTVLSKFIKA